MYRLTNKGERIREMFDSIAPRYDLLNRLLSLGIDRKWRRFAVKQIRFAEGGKVLDSSCYSRVSDSYRCGLFTTDD